MLSGPTAPARGTALAEPGILRAAAVVGAATLASRLLGFLRDLVLARTFGAGPATDAFFVAFRLPNLLRRLVGEGALASAFIPVFTDYLATRPRAEALRMFRAVSGAMTVALVLLTLLGVLLAPWLVRVMAPGFFAHPTTGHLTVQLTRVMFPYLLLVGLSALAMGILNAHRHFLAPALAPVMLNLAIIAAALGLAPHLREPVLALCAGVLAGGLGQLLIQLPALARRGVLLAPSLEPDHPAVRRIGRLLAPLLLGQSATQLNILVDTIIASFLAEGSVSYLYYADRLVEFPLGVFGIALATAVLPALSEEGARRDLARLHALYWFALRVAVFVSAPAAVGLYVLRDPLVRVLYQRGEFGLAEAVGTAWALGFYAPGLLGFAAVKIGAQAFYALGDTRTPVRVAIAAMAFNSALALGLARPLAHGGLALATSAAATAHAVALAILLGRRLGQGPDAATGQALARTGAASAALGLGLALASRGWPTDAGRLAEALWLGGLIAGGALVYFGVHAWFGSAELAVLREAWRRRPPVPQVEVPDTDRLP